MFEFIASARGAFSRIPTTYNLPQFRVPTSYYIGQMRRKVLSAFPLWVFLLEKNLAKKIKEKKSCSTYRTVSKHLVSSITHQ